jgi:phosphoglycerol transferase MdoB-like AlkP superfamily enzyme
LVVFALGIWAVGRVAFELGPIVAVTLGVWVKWVAAGVEVVPAAAQPASALLGTLGIVLLFCALLLIVPRRYRLIAALALDVAFTALVLADLLYFRYFGDIITVSAMTSATQLGAGLSTIPLLLRSGDALYFIDIAAGLVLLPLDARFRSRFAVTGMRSRAAFAAAILVIGFTVPNTFLGDNPLRSREEANERWWRLDAVPEVGLLPFHAFDLQTRWRYAAPGPGSISESARAEAARFVVDQRQRNEAVPRSPLFGVARGRNVILVMVESLAAFPIGLRVEGREVTPRLSAFAAESLGFSNFYDQTNEGGTSDGEFVSNQSLMPLPAGSIASRFPAHRFRGIAQILSERGYATLSGVGATPGSWNVGVMHPALGYRQSTFDDPGQTRERINGWLSDGAFFRLMLPKLQAATPPFAAYLITSSTHGPFDLPSAYRDLPLGDLEGTTLGRYLQTVHYLDRSFGEFIDGLRAHGILDSSVVAVYGDHRQYLPRWDEFNRVLALPANAEARRWLTRRRLPFIVRLPGASLRRSIRTPGGHLDVAPTLLSLLGDADRTAVMLGSDLTREPPAERPVVFPDGSWLDASHLYVRGMRVSDPDAC